MLYGWLVGWPADFPRESRPKHRLGETSDELSALAASSAMAILEVVHAWMELG